MNELRCFGCMKLKKGRPECEHCGYDERRPNAPHQLQPGTVLQNQYVVGRTLGQGGFGITYIGWDSFLEIPVAIKEYYPSTVVTRNATVSSSVYLQDEKGQAQYTSNLKRFAKEARSLAKLGAEEDLNRIVRVQNLVQANNTAYIIMEYVAGVDLREHMQRKGRSLTARETLELLLPLVSALDKVHTHGIIHRDISPDNIMVTHDGRAKLIDFGASHLSQMDDYGKQKSTEAIVKHGFAPMEQYSRRGNLGPWTDVYAMCATVYYCLTGQVLPPVMDRSFYGEEIDWSIVRGLSNGQLQTLKDGLTLDTASRIQSMAQLHTRLLAAEEPEIDEEPVLPEEESAEEPENEEEPEILPEQAEPDLEPEPEMPVEAAEQREDSVVFATEPVQEAGGTALLTPELLNSDFAATEPVQEEAYTTLLPPEQQANFGIAPTVPVEEAFPAIEPTVPVEEELPPTPDSPEEEAEEVTEPEIPEQTEEVIPESPAEPEQEDASAEEPTGPELIEETPAVPEEEPELPVEEIPEEIPEEEPEEEIQEVEEPETPEGNAEELPEAVETEEESVKEPEEAAAEPVLSDAAVEEAPEAGMEEPAEEPEAEIPAEETLDTDSGAEAKIPAEEPADEIPAEEPAEEPEVLPREEEHSAVAVAEETVEAEPEAEPELPAKAPAAKKKASPKLWIAAAAAVLVCVLGIFLLTRKPAAPKQAEVVPTTEAMEPATEETAPPTTEATEPEIDPSLWMDNVLMDTYDGAEYDTYQHNVGKQIYRSQYMNFQIRAVYFLDTLAEEPEDSWDVSAARDGRVKAWARKNGERYDLYIAAEGGINGAEACKRMFFGFAYMEEVDFGKAFHTDEATDMSDMFSQCYELKALDVSTFRTGKVTNMAGMFSSCQSMTSLDVSSFDTSQVTSMCQMFETCMGLTSLDVTGFDTSRVTDMSWMFMMPDFFGTGCALRELDLSSFTITQATNTEGMFEGCRSLTDVNHPQLNELLPKPDPDAWKNNVLMDTFDELAFADEGQFRHQKVFRSQIYNDQVKTVTFLDTLAQEPEDSWDVSAARDGRVKAWAGKNGELYDLYIAADGGINGADSKGLFLWFEKLEAVHFGKAFHTEQAQYMDGMFSGCKSLTALDLSSFNTSNVMSMSGMFTGCTNLASLDVSSFDTGKVTNMSGMFSLGDGSYSALKALDVSHFDTSNVTNMSSMFHGCAGLKTLDLGNFDTAKVTYMPWMFYGCKNLTKLDLRSFDTSRVESMQCMFQYCAGLKTLDLSSFDTVRVNSFASMFQNCKSLTELDLGTFHTGRADTMDSMFWNCESLKELNVSSFQTDLVTNMNRMFQGCRNLTTLDLSGFQYHRPMKTDMFRDCDKLVDVNHPDYNKLLG